jgi:methyl-accepting chemotaxis protein
MSTLALNRAQPNTDDPVTARDRFADRFMLASLGLGAVLALVIGQQHGGLGVAATGAALLLGLGAATLALPPGGLLVRLVLASTVMGMVALQIQVGRGTLEYHFGVFVTLALLLVYRDWRPLVAAAAVIAVHHVVADRLQAAGYAVYCTPSPDLLKMVVHALYVVVQTGLEVYLALSMRAGERAEAQLTRLVHRVSGSERVCLDVQAEPADTPSAQSLQTALGRVDSALVQVRDSVAGMRSSAQEIATSNQDLSVRTERNASSLQQAASLLELLTQAVRHSAESAGSAEQLAGSAAQVAQRGGSLMGQVVTSMDEIQASSRKISDIIGTIDGIAFQTNILALNAAVEAARAGEQGRGFAVVAAEVRSLAQRSAGAAREIKTLINNSVERVESGTRQVQDAGSTMGEIVASVQRVADIIGEISAAATEQRHGIDQLNLSISTLDQMTQQNAALVEEGAAVSASLRDQAESMAGAVRVFDLSAGAPAAASQTQRVTPTVPGPTRPARPAPARPASSPNPVPAVSASAEHADWQSF